MEKACSKLMAARQNVTADKEGIVFAGSREVDDVANMEISKNTGPEFNRQL